MNEQPTAVALRTLSGGANHCVTLKAITDGHLEDFPLAAPLPQDFIDAKDYMVRDRTKKAIDDTASGLDPDTRAKLIAEVRTRTQSHNSVLLDVDGITYMTFLMARRAGFSGNWDGFRASIQGADFRKLQDGLFDLCGINTKAEGAPSANPPGGGMIAP